MRFNLYFCAVNNPNVLKWNERLIIVVDAAQGIQSTFILNYSSLCFLLHFTLILCSMVSYGFSGLDYLHNGCTPPLIHRDLKPSNKLQDQNMHAKIADFVCNKNYFSTIFIYLAWLWCIQFISFKCVVCWIGFRGLSWTW